MVEANRQTTTDRIFTKIKDHRIIAGLIVFASVVIGLGQLTGAIDDILTFFGDRVADNTKCSNITPNFEYEATQIIRYYQLEYRRFPFHDDKGEPSHTELQEFVSLADSCIDIREQFPIQSAILWKLWGVRWLTDNKIRPKERIKLAIQYFNKSNLYYPDQDKLRAAIKDLEISIRPENELEGGKMDAMPFTYYAMALSRGHHSSSLEDFRDEFKNDSLRALEVSPSTDEEIAMREDKGWLFTYATRTPIKTVLEQLEREIYVKQGKSTKATIKLHRNENEHTIIEVSYPDRNLKWKVDMAARRYSSLNKETESFMLNYVSAVPNTFSESFYKEGKNKPLRKFIDGEIHSYTNYTMTWWLDVAAPKELESMLAALFLSDAELQNPDEIIGKKVDINFISTWLADDILEVKLNQTVDIGSGSQDYSFVWHISPIKKKYVSISQDARLYDLMVKLK